MMHGYGYFGRGGHMGAGLFNRTCSFATGHFSSVWSWLVIAGVILLVIAVIYFLAKGQGHIQPESNALEALKTKFVNGEIDEEEYKARKDVLNGK